MSELSIIARPYAQAVFEIARDSNRFDEWSESLRTLSEIVEHPELAALLKDPRVARDQVLGIVLEIGGEQFDDETRNLARILSHYRRMSSIPLIAQQYESLRAQAEGVIEAELETAWPIDDAQQDTLSEALQERLGRKVRLTSNVNKDLIGGAIIHAGDWVIDGSIRARLAKLASALGV